MKLQTVFNTIEEYELSKGSEDISYPNVSYIVEDDSVRYIYNKKNRITGQIAIYGNGGGFGGINSSNGGGYFDIPQGSTVYINDIDCTTSIPEFSDGVYPFVIEFPEPLTVLSYFASGDYSTIVDVDFSEFDASNLEVIENCFSYNEPGYINLGNCSFPKLREIYGSFNFNIEGSVLDFSCDMPSDVVIDYSFQNNACDGCVTINIPSNKDEFAGSVLGPSLGDSPYTWNGGYIE